MNSKIVVGRKWNNPEIYAYCDSDKVEMQISVADFINALVEEAGSPATVMTKAGLKSRLQEAAQAVLTEIKKASKEVV